MVYSEVVAQGRILPIKKTYTKADVERVVVDSLFKPGGTVSRRTAAFIVKCSAVFHGTDYSQSVAAMAADR